MKATRRRRLSYVVALALLVALSLAPTAEGRQAEPAAGDAPLSLERAIELAEARSEQLAIARAGVQRAQGEIARARSGLFPQLDASASYDRTLATEFEGIFGGEAGPPCDPFTLRPEAPLADRVAEIERAIDCGAIANPFAGAGDVELPFGQRNIYRLNLNFSQNLYTGGRISAQRSLAGAGRRLADVGVTSARAQAVLDAVRAYFDAALSDRLVTIAESALRQATATLEQVELSRQAGRLPEFELLRARVARDNQRPVLLRTQAQRTLAYLRLRQLLHLPDGAPLKVAANLDDPSLPPPAAFVESLAIIEGGRESFGNDRRVAVLQAEAGVAAREAAARLARSARLPNLSLNSSYGRVGYATFPSFNDFRTNWTVGVIAQIPVLTGGRLRADEAVAAADLAEARSQLELARNLTVLDTRSAFEELDASRATWEASAGTVEQAAEAYDIAQLRYREGISTQLELSDARFLLEQAQANRAQAARDLQIARARVALLPDLPLGTSGPSVAGSAPGFGAAAGGSGIDSASAVQGRGVAGQTNAVQTRPGGIRQ
jgi:outer membrane protein TolC